MRRDSGFTLVELIVFVVVVSVGIAGILLPITTSVGKSADPVVARQMTLIADSLMDEIMAKDSVNDTCTSTIRAEYNDVNCYNGYSTTGIQAIDGTPITELKDYSVAVSVVSGTVTVTNGNTTVDASGGAVRIAITVTYGADNFTLEGYRFNYE